MAWYIPAIGHAMLDVQTIHTASSRRDIRVKPSPRANTKLILTELDMILSKINAYCKEGVSYKIVDDINILALRVWFSTNTYEIVFAPNDKGQPVFYKIHDVWISEMIVEEDKKIITEDDFDAAIFVFFNE